MSPLLSAFLFFAVAFVNAAPLTGYRASLGPEASLSPLAVALTVLPLPLLAAIKYTYVRFRRAQSIHAHPHSSNTVRSDTSSPRLSVPASASGPEKRPSAGFWFTLTPYLVGFLGSPKWETAIRSRLDKTIRQAKAASLRSSRRSLLSPRSPALGDTSGTTANTSSAYYSSFSHKSQRSQSKSRSVSYGDNSAENIPSPRFTSHAFSAITDCSIIHPSSPACQHGIYLPTPPPAAYLTHAPLGSSVQRRSPTLMQVMEPVLTSWYDDGRGSDSTGNESKGTQSTLDSSHSSTSMRRETSDRSSDSPSLPFQTPMTSPPTPGMPGGYSSSSMPFTLLRKQLGLSATSSALSLDAVSSTSLSVAVFHSPAAPSILVPQPVYTPVMRPASCAVLPTNWQVDPDRLSVPSFMHSPTHRSPAPGRPAGIHDLLANPPIRPSLSPKVSFSPVPSPPASPVLSQGAGPVVLKSALKKRGSTSPALPSSLRNSVSFSLMSFDVTGAEDSIFSANSATNIGTSKNRKSWDITDLMHNGELDVDAITCALGLGLGVGLDSRSSVGSVPSPSVTLTFVPNTPAEDAETEYDIEQYAAGWGSPQLPNAAGASEGEGVQMRWHVHGLQLTAIPEEPRSEVCSVAGSVHAIGDEEHDHGAEDTELVQDSGIMSMEMDSEVVDVQENGGDAAEVRSSGVRPESWREGESVATLSVGLAW